MLLQHQIATLYGEGSCWESERLKDRQCPRGTIYLRPDVRGYQPGVFIRTCAT